MAGGAVPVVDVDEDREVIRVITEMLAGAFEKRDRDAACLLKGATDNDNIGATVSRAGRSP